MYREVAGKSGLSALIFAARDKRCDATRKCRHSCAKPPSRQPSHHEAERAFREGSLPFADCAMITALHWNEAPSDADSNVLAEGLPGAGLESTFAGSTVNVQFMVK